MCTRFMFWITFQLLLKPVHEQSQEPQSIYKKKEKMAGDQTRSVGKVVMLPVVHKRRQFLPH